MQKIQLKWEDTASKKGKKNPPTTLNCFLILEKPKEKNKCILNLFKEQNL